MPFAERDLFGERDAQELTLDAAYRVTVHGAPLQTGNLWLYRLNHGGLEPFLLGRIQRGAVRAVLTAQDILATIEPHTTGQWYLLALEADGIGWYKTPGFIHLRELEKYMTNWGGSAASPGVIDVPAPLEQRIHLLNPDGTPRRRESVGISTFVSTDNHCGVHVGFAGIDPERLVTTDEEGVATFIAPLQTVHLHRSFYTERTTPMGRVLTKHDGEELPGGREYVVRHIWEREPDRRFRMRVVRPDGSPVRDVTVWYSESSDSCAGPGPVGTSGRDGEVELTLSPAHVDAISLRHSSGSVLDLDANALQRLYRSGSLTVVWQETGVE